VVLHNLGTIVAHKNVKRSAASAIAGNTFLRSLAGAGFPLFSTYMFEGMGIQWASTLLGCVAALLVPIPVIFYVYGHRIRQHSSFAPTAPPRAAAAFGNGEASDDAANGNGDKETQVDSSAAAAAPQTESEAVVA
jgi:MFS transporter, DHA1 family, multidrug resistance protein